MEYIEPCDYDYIMNKYHAPGKPRARFPRNDGIFDEASGMAPDGILAGVMEQDEKLKDLPHPIRKAKALAYILENTRISCDKRDIFPAFNMTDRPMQKTLFLQWYREVFEGIIPEIEQQRRYLAQNGIACCAQDYDHSTPYWDILFEKGFPGVLENSEQARNAKPNLTENQQAFYDSVKISYEAVLRFLERLEERAKKDGNSRMAQALSAIRVGPPRTFYEALLLDFIYFMVNEHVDVLQVRSLSNFDRLFYKFYKSDLEKGVSEEQIRRDLAYFFLQFVAIGNYYNQPVFLGGCKADESTEINELSYLFLDVYEKMGIYNPKIQIKVADSTPKDFLCKALNMIRSGKNSIVFVCDATIRKALERAGRTPEQARLCNITGCYEYSCQGSFGAGMNYVNLLKPIEYALHKGCDGITGNFAGLECPNADDYETFEEFYAAYKAQLSRVMGLVMEMVNAYEDYHCYIAPQPMLSATFPTCVEQGKDAMEGGALTNGTGMAFGFLADAVDSLTNIKKYVFEKKLLTLGQLRDILDADYEGNEYFRRIFLADRDKYGNNKDVPDAIAKDIVEFICQQVIGKPNAKNRGGKWGVGFHVADQVLVQAPTTASSANGRLKGEELSKNMSASAGMNREGATAAILSITKIDATAFTSDASLDLGLLPASVKGEDGLEAMYGLLMTFIKRGGHAMHINVFSADTLRDAQVHPEKYQDLQIRVSGWNVLWNNLSKEEQDGYIRQAEGLV